MSQGTETISTKPSQASPLLRSIRKAFSKAFCDSSSCPGASASLVSDDWTFQVVQVGFKSLILSSKSSWYVSRFPQDAHKSGSSVFWQALNRSHLSCKAAARPSAAKCFAASTANRAASLQRPARSKCALRSINCSAVRAFNWSSWNADERTKAC